MIYKFTFVLMLLIGGQKSHAQSYDVDSLNRIIDSIKEDSLDRKIYKMAQKEPQFPGSKSAWFDYVRLNMDNLLPEKNMAPPGIYRVLITFVVDRNGSLRDFVSESHNGFGMENEVLRILRMSPRWVPAVQNGYRVNYAMRLPVSFVVAEK